MVVLSIPPAVDTVGDWPWYMYHDNGGP